MKPDRFVKSDNEFIVIETSLRANVPADQILDSIRQMRATGQLTFYFIDGGIRSVMLVEKTKAADSERGRVREFQRTP